MKEWEALGSSGRGAGHLDLSVLTEIGQRDGADGRGTGFICLGRQRGIDERKNKQGEISWSTERDREELMVDREELPWSTERN